MSVIMKMVTFTGSVQGVGFRYTSQRMAMRYNLLGYVKNMPDGSVEMLIQGPDGEVDFCIEDIRESFKGHIRKVRINELPADPRYIDFKIEF